MKSGSLIVTKLTLEIQYRNNQKQYCIIQSDIIY